jgi:general secretion pathway protein K
MRRSSQLGSRGIALITAMLVMALAAIAAAAVLGSANAAIRRTGTLIDGERAWWYADGLETWVISILKRDREDNDVDSLDENWARPVDYLPVEQGALRGHLEDLQGRFNLNNLGSNKPLVYVKQFQRLFGQIPGLDASQASAIAEAIRDWIDVNQVPGGSGGAEDSEYQGLAQPYRTADQALQSPTELLAIKGVTPEIYRALAPFVTALPLGGGSAPTPINVNTAKAEVLYSLSDQIDANKMRTWIEKQKTEPVDSPQKLQRDGTLPADVTADMVSAKTSYFLMVAEAFIGSGRVALYSVMLRPSSGSPIVISRSLDTE